MARFGGGVRCEEDQLLRDEDSLSGEHGLELPAELMALRFPDLHRDGGGSPSGRGASKR